MVSIPRIRVNMNKEYVEVDKLGLVVVEANRPYHLVQQIGIHHQQVV